MAIRRISAADLAVGEPLRWDLYSTPSAARPFMQKGQVIDRGELDFWLEAGLYAYAAAPSSVLQSLNQINRRLERTLKDLRGLSSADAELRSIAQDLMDTVERGRDIALATVFLSQIAGPYLVRHCTEAAIVACLIARAMDKTAAEVLLVTAAALTMNVGMVRQGELFQDRDVLTSAERALVRRHPAESVDLLRWAGIRDEEWLSLVLLHHENDDGSGYPNGMLGSEISQNAKLIGLADRYCAFVSARNYRRSLLPPLALDKLHAETEMPFDRAVIALFEEEIGAHPPGTLVRLQNGEQGVVSGRQCVHVLRGPDGLPVAEVTVRASHEDGCGIVAALHEDEARLRFSMKLIWGELASI